MAKVVINEQGAKSCSVGDANYCFNHQIYKN